MIEYLDEQDKQQKEKQIIEDLATITCEEVYNVYFSEVYNV